MSASILRILQNQLIPQVEQFSLSQLIVARETLAEMPRRANFRFTSQPLLGPRRGVRSFTFGMTTAQWPKDNLVETSCPLLTFILEGNADMRFGDYWLHAAEGQGVFALANVPRKSGKVPYLHPVHQKEGHCATLNFTEVRGRIQIWHNRSLGKVHKISKEIPRVYTLGDREVQLLRQMQFHFAAAGSDDNVICLHLLKAFLLSLEKDLRAGDFLQSGLLKKAQRQNLRDPNPVSKAQEYVRSHLQESLTLQNVARQVHMSRTQFALRFRHETGQTFNEFVTACRMEQAKVLLRETDYTLTFVCLSVGYRSLTYFRRLFLKREKMSPREYREKATRKKRTKK